ncbi:helix-turn-helix domain-containing protein [Arthrobacter sp. BE255]|uniref:IclR family transcriptional regulator n=1 Tax=Arthrobacter sp. BE255 TaxID=2817721 RepID=UPI00285A6A9C|nr:helix-turn-helix domain-containing protein [Arthrobacter sp. BE255]MDR7161940.1 DNA-binding IclR family transcriptional regulator [Arthrobacter sp. BE255]
MSAELERGLHAIEMMSQAPRGLTFTDIATALGTSKGPTHRLLGELTRLGYARIDEFGRYHLTLKLTSHALQYLELIPLVSLAGPLLEDLAVASGELARLNLVDGNDLVRVSKAQGRQSGLKYDPLHVHGGNIPLASTASGLLLLSSLSDDEAAVRLQAEGFSLPDEYGSAAPRSIEEALNILHRARTAGFLYLPNIFEEGIAALAYPIRAAGSSDTVGVLTVSGPSFRFTEEAAQGVLPVMEKISGELGRIPVADMLGSYVPTHVAREL